MNKSNWAIKHKGARFLGPMLALCALVPLASWAESGTVEIVQAGINTAVAATQVGSMTATVRGGPTTLTISRVNGAGAFVEGEIASGQCVAFSKKTSENFDLEAYCSASFSPQDSISLAFRRKTGDIVEGSSGQGVEQIANGTGRFSGINGECTYTSNSLANNAVVTLSKCKWNK